MSLYTSPYQPGFCIMYGPEDDVIKWLEENTEWRADGITGVAMFTLTDAELIIFKIRFGL